jgi:ABC-type glycerol-3-phosphate transport system permease component
MARDGVVRGAQLRRVVADVLLVVGSVVFAFPILWMVWTALKPAELAYQPDRFAVTPSLESFQLVFAESSIPRFFINTFVIASLTTLISLFVGGFAAYAITRYRTFDRKTYALFLLPVIIPPMTLAVSLFYVFNFAGLTNTRPTVVFAQLSFGIPFAVWFLTDFFRELPVELEEAAMVDGDSRIEAVLFVLVPNMKNGIFATGTFIFIYAWNNFLFPLLLTSKDARTLPVEINNFNTFEGLLISEMSAAIIITIVPVLVLAFFAQSYLVSGIAAGSGVD